MYRIGLHKRNYVSYYAHTMSRSETVAQGGIFDEPNPTKGTEVLPEWEGYF